MKSFWILLGMIAVLSGARVGAVAAGECVELREDYVRMLEAGPRSEEFEYAIGCVDFDLAQRGSLWAGPVAARDFAAVRADTLRPRIERAITRLFRSAWADSGSNRQVLYSIAAYNAIPRLDMVDVYAARFGDGDGPWERAYEELAILQDCRAVDLLARRYAKLRTTPKGRYPEEVLDVLSCLYHIPCPQSVALAKRLRAHEKDATLRARLQKVIDRP